MKTALFVLFFLTFTSIVFYYYLSQAQFGASPDAESVKNFKSVKNFDPATLKFKNTSSKNMNDDMEVIPMLKEYAFGKQTRQPTEPLPFQKTNLLEFAKNDGKKLKWIWLGHSTVYLNLESHLILLDPVFSSASPFSFLLKRYQAPLFLPAELPQPEVIVLSHDHYDHLDANTMRFYANRSPQFIVPLGVGSRLISYGIPKEKITELAWDETATLGKLKFSATEAQHFSGRGIFDSAKTLWAGFVIETKETKVFYTGDTGYSPHFKKIAEKHAPFDLVLIESGQYNKWWRFVHLLPEEVIQALTDLKAKKFMPVHWATYTLALHDWFEPIERVSDLSEKAGLEIYTPLMGEILSLEVAPEKSKWWRDHIDFKNKYEGKH